MMNFDGKRQHWHVQFIATHPVGLVAEHCPKVANDVDDAKDEASLTAENLPCQCNTPSCLDFAAKSSGSVKSRMPQDKNSRGKVFWLTYENIVR